MKTNDMDAAASAPFSRVVHREPGSVTGTVEIAGESFSVTRCWSPSGLGFVHDWAISLYEEQEREHLLELEREDKAARLSGSCEVCREPGPLKFDGEFAVCEGCLAAFVESQHWSAGGPS